MVKTSLTYKTIKALGFNYSEQEYGSVALGTVITKVISTYKNSFLLAFMDSAIFAPFLPRRLRPFILRCLGCKIGRGVFIGDHVRIDSGYARYITIEDNVHITGGCRLLCHQRDLKEYRRGDDSSKLPYRKGTIHLKKGVMVGMHSVIMPGVTIGEGAIIGACSLVTKDIPDWCIAIGQPAKAVKQIQERDTQE